MSLNTFYKVARSPKAQEWITQKCEKAYKKAKAKNKNLECKLPNSTFSGLKARHGSWTFGDSLAYDIYYIETKNHKFNLALFVYNKTIKKFKLILWDKKEDKFEYVTVNFGKFQVDKDYDRDVDSDITD